MLDDSHAGGKGKGIWLWTIASGLLLFLMEFILFAALVPTHWARQASEAELVSLLQTLGPHTTDAILNQAAGWFDTLFIRTGVVSASYHLLIPDPHTPGAGMVKLAENPFWPWLAGRLEVVWIAIAQACQRVAMLCAWWPFFLILFLAAWGDGWVRRRIRQHSFAYASPLAHALALRIILWLLIGALMLLFAPLALPALGVPLFGAVIAGLLGFAVANTQKRL